MSIQHDVTGILPYLRQEAESMMTSTATVSRATGATTTNTTTLEEELVFATVLTGVKCKIKTSGANPADAGIPGQVAASTIPEWHCPISTVGIKTGDQVTITAVDSLVGDPETVGKKYRIEGPFLRDNATARRFRIELWS